MRTFPDCFPCLRKQAGSTISRVTGDPARQQAILAAVAALLDRLDPSLSPPENAAFMYRLIAEHSGVTDPYAAIKAESNRLAGTLRSQARKGIAAAADPLLAAIQYAMAGNVMDYGAHHDFDAEETLAACLGREAAINDYQEFRRDLAAARTVLYLADNCGELVFDGLLIEQLEREVTVAVKAAPVINDAQVADAVACGIDRIARVVSNGTACPGTPLSRVSAEFRKLFAEADLIISKGQGNFETLSECGRSLYFLLTVKCPVVSRYLGEKTGRPAQCGDAVLLKHRPPGA
ncbi:MAG: ARMT1-like domain-containing protein [Thermodesulfobacteriota bacterium]